MAKNPIGKVERERLGGAFRQLQDAVALIQAAKRCGIHCGEREQLARQIHDVLSSVQTEFVGPNPATLQSTPNGQPYHTANPSPTT